MATVLEILNASNSKVAILDEQECDCQVYRRINGEWNLQVSYPIPNPLYAEDKSAYLNTFGYKIRVKDTVSGVYSTFVINRVTKEKAQNGTLQVKAFAEHAAIVELNNKVITADFKYSNALPATILARILAYTSYASGTVNPTAKIQLTDVSWEKCMSGLQKLLRSTGAEYDVDEASGEIDILTSLGANNYVRVFAGKNLQAIQNTYYNRDVINKVYGVGSGSPAVTIAGARHVVSGYVSGTGILTALGNKIVPENDSWNTNYQIRFKTGAEAGTAFTISDCVHSAATDTLTISTGRTIAAGDKFVIETTGSVEVNFIRAGTSITTYGTVEDVYKNERFTDAINLVDVPALDGTYTAGLCEKWTKEGTPTVTEETSATYIIYGSKSQKVVGDADAEGISQAVAVTSGKYYTTMAWVYISAGTVLMQVSDGTNTYQVSRNAVGWNKLVISERMASGTLTLKVLQSGATAATFWVDAVQVTEGVIERSFSANCDLKDLWDETFDKIVKSKDPLIEYNVNFVDLYKINPQEYPYDQISLGDTVTVYDPELGINGLTARVKEITQDIFHPQNTVHVISNV